MGEALGLSHVYGRSRHRSGKAKNPQIAPIHTDSKKALLPFVSYVFFVANIVLWLLFFMADSPPERPPYPFFQCVRWLPGQVLFDGFQVHVEIA